MTRLDEYLAWLQANCAAPAWRDIAFIDDRAERYEKDDDGVYRWHLSRDDFKSREQLESRLVELISAGHSWINLCCRGILDGTLVLAIEYRRDSARHDGTPTPVQFSGPSIDVRTRAAIWDARVQLKLL